MLGTFISRGCPDCPGQGALRALRLPYTYCNPPAGSEMAEASVLGAHEDLILLVATSTLSLISGLIFYVVHLLGSLA